MFKFLTGFWLPVLFLLMVFKASAAGVWLVLPLVLVPAWLLYCLASSR